MNQYQYNPYQDSPQYNPYPYPYQYEPTTADFWQLMQQSVFGGYRLAAQQQNLAQQGTAAHYIQGFVQGLIRGPIIVDEPIQYTALTDTPVSNLHAQQWVFTTTKPKAPRRKLYNKRGRKYYVRGGK